MNGSPRIPGPRLVIGLFLVLLGAVLVFDEVGLFDADLVLPYWSLVLVLIGALQLLRGTGPLVALLLIAAGIWILAFNLGWTEIELSDAWPLILVLIGLALVRQALRDEPAEKADQGDRVSVVSIFADRVVRSASARFAGGRATAMLGAAKVDLTHAGIDGTAVLDVFAFWGGIEVTVPQEWGVIGQVVPVMAAFEDKTHPGTDDRQRLVIRGAALMGGIEVRHAAQSSAKERWTS
ncbi:MAG TPA: DUF5668 domain-containing protein [Thermoanaerobaculia bacterium]|nr:DUF5668 domain-containing protein [Thermoanaerobaculia bacterium]